MGTLSFQFEDVTFAVDYRLSGISIALLLCMVGNDMRHLTKRLEVRD